MGCNGPQVEEFMRNARPKRLFNGVLQWAAMVGFLKNYQHRAKLRCMMGLQWVATGVLLMNYPSDQKCDVREGCNGPQRAASGGF